MHELRKRDLQVLHQMPIPVIWDGRKMDIGFRADLMVENKVIVELKSVENIHPVHKKIPLTCLRIADRRLGLLLNFGMELFKDGVSRIVNKRPEQVRGKSIPSDEECGCYYRFKPTDRNLHPICQNRWVAQGMASILRSASYSSEVVPSSHPMVID